MIYGTMLKFGSALAYESSLFKEHYNYGIFSNLSEFPVHYYPWMKCI